jgi:tetratricopeptide (TPR) repeat protein
MVFTRSKEMGRVCAVIFMSIVVAIIAVNSNLYSEFKPSENGNINNKSQNTDQENNYNFEKNNYFVLIEMHIEKNKNAAQKLLDEFNAKFPNNQEMKYYYYSAIINESKGETIKAIQNYRKAISIYPAYSHARDNLGCLYLRLKNYNESEEQLLKAVEANPYNPFINYNTGELYYKIKKFDLAEKYYSKACKYKANYGEAFNKLGMLLYNKKEYLKALEFLNKALQFNNTQYDTYYFIGLSYDKLGQTDLAISNLKKSVNIKKDFYRGIIDLGRIYEAFKEYKSAVKYYLLAESINSDDQSIRILLCECYKEMKRYDDAIDIIENLIKKDPGNKKYAEMLADIKGKQISEN